MRACVSVRACVRACACVCVCVCMCVCVCAAGGGGGGGGYCAVGREETVIFPDSRAGTGKFPFTRITFQVSG